MASFTEAMAAARQGKRVRCRDWSAKIWAEWKMDHLLFENNGNDIYIDATVIDGPWEIESPSYSFLEAVEMMEKEPGKKMRSRLGQIWFYTNGIIVRYGSECAFPNALSPLEIRGKWTEVT